jgi:predicted nucleotidyltransferase
MDEFTQFLRARREAAGLSQARLAELSGVQQSTIAAIERGRRAASADARDRLTRALRIRPRDILLNRRDDVVATAAEFGVTDVRVFGSVARGEDTPWSDVDLMAKYPDGFDLADKYALVEALEEVLTVDVDVISQDSDAPAVDQARDEAVPL